MDLVTYPWVTANTIFIDLRKNVRKRNTIVGKQHSLIMHENKFVICFHFPRAQGAEI